MNVRENMKETPQWNVRAGMIYYGEKPWRNNPQNIFKENGLEYPRVHSMEQLIDIFNRNRWLPDPSDLECDA